MYLSNLTTKETEIANSKTGTNNFYLSNLTTKETEIANSKTGINNLYLSNLTTKETEIANSKTGTNNLYLSNLTTKEVPPVQSVQHRHRINIPTLPLAHNDFDFHTKIHCWAGDDIGRAHVSSKFAFPATVGTPATISSTFRCHILSLRSTHSPSTPNSSYNTLNASPFPSVKVQVRNPYKTTDTPAVMNNVMVWASGRTQRDKTWRT